MKLKLAVIILATAIPGCVHPQPAPTKGYNTLWTWSAPTSGSCTTDCSYIVSTLSVASGTASCPAPTGQYVPQQTATTALTTTSWTQVNTTGQVLCAVVSAYFNSATSPASTASNVVTNPSLPLAPGVPAGNTQVQADLVKPQLMPAQRNQQLTLNAVPLQLFGRVVRTK